LTNEPSGIDGGGGGGICAAAVCAAKVSSGPRAAKDSGRQNVSPNQSKVWLTTRGTAAQPNRGHAPSSAKRVATPLISAT